MKKLLILLLSMLMLLSVFVSCESNESNDTESLTTAQTETGAVETTPKDEDLSEIFGSYSRKNSDDILGSFSITLNADGTYSYYETMISSHIGLGQYTVDGNIITLIDDNIPGYSGSLTHTFKFEYRDGKLIYLAKESNKFMYVNLPDGAEFDRVQIES